MSKDLLNQIPRLRAPSREERQRTNSYQLVEDENGKYVEFKYLWRAYMTIDKLTGQKYQIMRELKAAQDINETRMLLEKKIMQMTEALIHKHLGTQPLQLIANDGENDGNENW